MKTKLLSDLEFYRNLGVEIQPCSLSNSAEELEFMLAIARRKNALNNLQDLQGHGFLKGEKWDNSTPLEELREIWYNGNAKRKKREEDNWQLQALELGFTWLALLARTLRNLQNE